MPTDNFHARAPAATPPTTTDRSTQFDQPGLRRAAMVANWRVLDPRHRRTSSGPGSTWADGL